MNKLEKLVKRLQEFKEEFNKVAKSPKEELEKQVNEQPGAQPNQGAGAPPPTPMAMSEKCEIAKNGQWNLVQKADDGQSRFHLHVDGQRVTDKPLTLRDVQEKWGGVKQVEKIPGHVLVPHKESIAAPKIKKP